MKRHWEVWTPGLTSTRMSNDSAMFVFAFRDKGEARRFLRRLSRSNALVGYSLRRGMNGMGLR